MNIGEICSRDVVCTDVETPVAAVAKLMRQYHIGDVIVIRNDGGKRVPVGIVTDRDIVLSVVADELAPAALTVGDIMGERLATAEEEEDVFATIQRMRDIGVRRMPIVDAGGALCGIVSIDDIIEVLVGEMTELARLISREHVRTQQTRK
jgi:CBS domain-containing protein